MGFLSILSFGHKLAEERVKPGEPVVDATAGNGVDTLFLARLTGPGGSVDAFDIQEAALEKTAERLSRELPGEACPTLRLHLASHDRMKELVPGEHHGRVAAVFFNLGYLPGADHSVITTAATTIPAMEAALELLRAGGVLVIVVYSGHEGGQAEAEAVETWACSLPQLHFHVLEYRFRNQQNNPPYVIAVEKR